MKNNSAEVQKIIKWFDQYFMDNPPVDPKFDEPDLEPCGPKPTDLDRRKKFHERLRIKEVRDAVNRKRKKKGLIPFV